MYDSVPCNVPPVVPLPVAAQLPYSLSYMLYPLMLVQEKPAVKSSTPRLGFDTPTLLFPECCDIIEDALRAEVLQNPLLLHQIILATKQMLQTNLGTASFVDACKQSF